MATAKKTTAAPASADPAPVTSSPANPADEVGAAEVQAKFDVAEAQGFFGSTPDATPNENYTLAGVVEGAPTPENQRGK